MERKNLLRLAVEQRKKQLIQRLEALGFQGDREALMRLTLTELENQWESYQHMMQSEEDDIG
ncbi:hypothetical protein JOD43_004024 [Pullulanibacillus pueri]|uniref:Fur-regulated basic protein FbpA n=1 Tax=Pullulanibacillus pueri TaxID=1437324 RepID=A0A8J3EQM0_9BACL|nr:Fur-regulated basic protein FbpA [Pullulanibacillus pueri]MBM7683833.1 hypothetical protein [Pullulanibacillus pueri]GGH87740.1 hypothetical protein GCM10007096_38450 [Pullulanibacillus pueri]